MPPDNKKSELEKLQTNSQLMTLVVESASDAIIIFNKKGDIFHFNMMAEKIFGRPRYQVENQILLYALLTTDSDTPFFQFGFFIVRRHGITLLMIYLHNILASVSSFRENTANRPHFLPNSHSLHCILR